MDNGTMIQSPGADRALGVIHGADITLYKDDETVTWSLDEWASMIKPVLPPRNLIPISQAIATLEETFGGTDTITPARYAAIIDWLTCAIDQPNDPEILCRELAVLYARERDIEGRLKSIAAAQGPISFAGIYVDNRQSFYDQIPVPDKVAKAKVRIAFEGRLPIGSDKIVAYLVEAYQKISKRSLRGFFTKMDDWDQVQTQLDRDPDAGMMRVYGEGRLSIRKTAPDEAKNHVIQPGEDPIPTIGYASEDDEGFDDDDNSDDWREFTMS